MTTYQRVDGTLTVGHPIPTIKLGATGATLLLTGSGLAGASGAVTWTDEVSGLRFAARSGCSVGTVGGKSALATTGGNPQGVAALSGFAFPSTGFTFMMVMNGYSGSQYAANLGEYKFGMSTGAGVQMERSGGTCTCPWPTGSNSQVVVIRCAGTASRIRAGGNTSSSNNLTDTAGSVLSPWIGRSTNAGGAASYILAFALWPRALADAEMDSVVTQQRANFTVN